MNCRSHRLALSISLSLALSTAAQSATAQQSEPDQPRATSTLDAVSVTGSRIKRAQVEGAQPVVTISAQQIQQEGFATVYDVLNSMNQQGSVEADTQWGSHTPNASPINLRDLGPGRTLLLVNGHRVADYPLPYGGESNFSNYSNIPSAAVERIEILTGGASAIYGSDAVAGVVNVILKRDYQGDQVRLRGGTATEGGRDSEARLYAPLSSSEYDDLVAKSHNSAYSWVNQASFSLSGDVVQGWAGPIRFATVAEVAKQGYQLSPDPCANECYPVDVVDSGGGERLRSSAGLEFQIPLLSTLSANVAGRYDRYGNYRSSAAIATDVGTQSDTTWSAGLEWRPVESLLLRSTLATSFRAPDMHYVLGEPSSTNQTVIDQYRCIATGASLTGGCNDENSNIFYTVDVNRRGTPDLRSETGRSFTGGVVWDIAQGLSLSVDYYRIQLEEMIKDLDRDEILSAEAGCRTGTTISGGAWNNPGGAGYCDTISSRVLRNADGTIASIERGPINLAQMETSGIDASLKYRLATAGWGNFQLSLDYNTLIAYREQIYRTDSDENRRDERVRSRVRGSVHWDNGGAWDWTVYFRRLGSMRAVNWGTCARFDDGYQPSAADEC
ncbi:TonB-dependent receptor, partial [Xanthomonas hortorum pv. vitians]